METRYLKTLLTSIEAGSFSRAAELLNITQSAVSQRIKMLEERYGHQLLDRSGATLVSTEAGEIVLERARVILEQERELYDALKRLGEKKRLAVCCTPTFGMAYLPLILNDFILRHADVADLKLFFQQPEAALRGLLENDFDIAILEHCDGCDLSPFHVESLDDDELAFVSAPSLGIPEGNVSLETLLTFRLYARRDGCSSKELLKASLKEAGSALDAFSSVVVSDDLRLTISSVVAGAGVSFLSRALISEQLMQKQLRLHYVKGFHHSRQRTLLLPKGRMGEPILRQFAECTLSVMGEERRCVCAGKVVGE
ncbi:MAG: LysR family transcriptional regulator [Desulfuromonas sp.]|nr:MAG: LysR family transcriptional regulator [Desulfuromonas sp.]